VGGDHVNISMHGVFENDQNFYMPSNVLVPLGTASRILSVSHLRYRIVLYEILWQTASKAADGTRKMIFVINAESCASA
jgi:hypothetical protein